LDDETWNEWSKEKLRKLEKKAVSGIMLILLLTGMLTLAFNIQPVKTQPTTIIVPDDYPTIQKAINSATDGYTIYVKAGIYYENVVVNKTVTLSGENRSTTIVDGNWFGIVVNITANDVDISGFTIRHSGPDLGDTGIYLNSSSNIVIRGNIVTNNTSGMWLKKASSNVIDENVITNSTIDGIYLGASNSNEFSGNLIVNNTYGIWLERFSNKNVIRGNTVTGNFKGIRLAGKSERNTVYGNIVTENEDGIDLSSSFNNIHENIIKSNFDGIYSAVTSEGNIICRNNLIDNVRQASIVGSVGVWDNGAEGNYWSDYAGEDADNDGIGDDSYIIDPNNNDTYPLMEPWSSFRIFNVLLEEETYHLTTLSNSTIASFNYNFSMEEVSFNVTGPSGASGFCNVTVPKILLENPLQVLVNGKNIIADTKIARNSTYTSTYLTYSFSTHMIKISGIEPEDKIPPISNAGPDQTVNEDTPVTFDGIQSSDNVGIVSYEWTFIDESPKTLTGINATYTFKTPSIYNVTLTVIDDSGNWDTDTVVITVLDVTEPIADAGQDKIIVQGTSVSFDASNSSDNVGIVSYEWDFGDGTDGTGISTSHTYSNPGTYKVTLTVRDEAGNVSTDSITVRVLSHFEVFPWWIIGVIALTGTVIGAILFWRHKVSKTRSKENIHGNVKK